ncbi:TIGR02186 family protein [Thalassobaculum sp.]|uniref:TIGR02186 family protein n=1 Tax=Thalassobaculum sp. TaxID=2022740 RepID=UPI0032EE574B
MRRAPASFLITAGLVLAAFVAAPAVRGQQDLVADLSDHEIAITTGFTGAELLLFGAIEGEGQIVVVVTGPRQAMTVRRKDRLAGIWMNTESMTFQNVPSFYAVAATGMLDEVDPDVRVRQEMGLDHLNLRPMLRDRDTPVATIRAFREGLVRNQVRHGLYSASAGRILVLSDRLFRTRVSFPANVVTGIYTVSVYYIRNGSPVHAQTTPLRVSKIGIGAYVFRFAHTNSAAYGVFAILVAVLAGWLAAVIFRKV